MDARYADDLFFGEEEYYTGYGSAVPKHVPEEIPEVVERPKEDLRVKAAPKTAPRAYVSLMAVVGFMFVILLEMVVVVSFVKLTSISSDIYELNEQLSELEKENKALTIAYESTFKLEAIEEYAENILGMEKESLGQVKYLDSQYEDHAVIVGDGADSGNILAKLKHILKGVTEYF